LPGWQQFAEKHAGDDFQMLSVAMDGGGVEKPRAFVEASGVTFPTFVDASGLLFRLYGFTAVPNGVYVDETGIIRFQLFTGFSVDREDVVEQLETLLATPAGDIPAAPTVAQQSLEIEVMLEQAASQVDDPGMQLGLAEALLHEGNNEQAAEAFRRAFELDSESANAAFGLGTALHQLGQPTEALASWRRALQIEPNNFIIRKQIWRVEYPEKFYPVIDYDWQKVKLAQEKAAEGRA
jgi:tetratricopeptide (TPR) repeat protein